MQKNASSYTDLCASIICDPEDSVLDACDRKLNEIYPGRAVRKDLAKRIREGAIVPVYVLEYLLGMYCATDDEETIEQGVKRVKQILSENYVRPDEAETVKLKVRERGRFNKIDRVDSQFPKN